MTQQLLEMASFGPIFDKVYLWQYYKSGTFGYLVIFEFSWIIYT